MPTLLIFTHLGKPIINSCGNMPVVVQNVLELLQREEDKPLNCSFPSVTILNKIYHRKTGRGEKSGGKGRGGKTGRGTVRKRGTKTRREKRGKEGFLFGILSAAPCIRMGQLSGGVYTPPGGLCTRGQEQAMAMGPGRFQPVAAPA